MNPSAMFIKRPVTTILLMLGILVFGTLAYQQLPVQRPADHRLPHHPGQRVAAWRQPRDDRVVGRAAAREAVRDDRRAAVDQLDQLAGQHQHHAAVRSEPQHRRRRAGRAGDDRQDRAAAAAADAGAAVVPEGEPRRSAGDVPGAALADAAALDGQRVRRDDDRPAHLDGERRGAGAGVRRGALRGARRSRSAAARRLRHRHRRGRERDRERERQPADRHDVRRRQDVHRAGERQAAARRRLRADDHRVPQRQSGAARRGRARLRRHRERQDAPAGTTASARSVLAIQKQPGTNVVAVVDAVKALLPTFREQLPAVGRRSTSAATAPVRSASRCATSSSRCC